MSEILNQSEMFLLLRCVCVWWLKQSPQSDSRGLTLHHTLHKAVTLLIACVTLPPSLTAC